MADAERVSNGKWSKTIQGKGYKMNYVFKHLMFIIKINNF
jgi:hypothetical protein